METPVKYPYQRTQTPMQVMFWSNYIDTSKKTFCNAYQSARVAGYTNESAKNVTRKGWFKHGEYYYKEVLNRAEEVILEDLTMNVWEDVMYRGKKTGEKRLNPNLVRLRSEISRFVLLTLGRKKYHYYKKDEHQNTNLNLIQGNQKFDNLFRKNKKLPPRK